MRIDSFYFSDRGGRRENEDSAGNAVNESGGIFVVADGLGGHMFGKRASEGVVISMLDVWERSGADSSAMEDWLLQSISNANSNILRMQEESHSNMKSTVVALYIRDKWACWANTGDSRLYFIRDGRLAGVTEDHSVAYKKYKSGEITRAQIATDEDQSSLLRALGNTSRWEPTLYGAELMPGDCFMLCSDGLWEYLSDEEVLADCLKARNAKDWAELLLVRAMGRIKPGNDNLTVQTIRIE